MSKILLASGVVLLAMGFAFLVAGQLDPMLHNVLMIAGILWSVIGGIILGVGIKLGHKSKRKLEALR